jgi:ribosomal protein S12 methylthiotransferase accessory factor
LETVRGLLADSFRFAAPDAPGLHFMGALADPSLAGLSADLPKISTAGSDLSAEGAEIRCLGEAAERLSSLYDRSRAVEPVARAEVPGDLLALLEKSEKGASVPCLQGQRLNDGEAVWVPAALVLHDPLGTLGGPGGKAAKGIAAGPGWQNAVDRALAELVERDAVALWWLGGELPAPVSLELLAEEEAAAVLQALRQGQRGRRTWLLDLSAGFGLTAIAAVSVMADGEGFACGLSAGPNPANAMRSALVEMAQMELSQHLIRGKAKALGPEGLTEADFRQIERSVRITPESCPLIVPHGAPRPILPPQASPAVMLMELGPLYVVDCTLPALDIPVAAVLAPALQAMDMAVETARLRAAIQSTGGGDQYHHGVQLI